MNNEQIKDLLLDIRNSELDFSVTLSGKESKRVNGLYKPESREIILHNKNFNNDNQLIYTAIHEYTHHIMNEQIMQNSGGKLTLNTSRSHTNAFWALFHELLVIAEEKDYYKLTLEESPELEEVTKKIRTEYLEKNGQLMIEFGKLLMEAHKLCTDANIRYEDYIDRVLQLPRQAAKTITAVSNANINPAVGFENMKLLASIKNKDKRIEAEAELESGKSYDTVRNMMKRKSKEVDEKTKLEKEKQRLEKTIAALKTRLEIISDTLEQLG
ncbi:MAG: hypothetical protein GX220_03525 [Treponema sp.]|nr:hypothetical protein [Treponema sp.]